MKIKKFILPILIMSAGLISCGGGAGSNDKQNRAGNRSGNNAQLLGAGSTFV